MMIWGQLIPLQICTAMIDGSRSSAREILMTNYVPSCEKCETNPLASHGRQNYDSLTLTSDVI